MQLSILAAVSCFTTTFIAVLPIQSLHNISIPVVSVMKPDTTDTHTSYIPLKLQLTLEFAKKVGAGVRALDSLKRVKPQLALPQVPQAIDHLKAAIDDYEKQLSTIPEAVAALAKIGLTPDTYSIGYVRIMDAWHKSNVFTNLERAGMDISAWLPKQGPNAPPGDRELIQDMEFVRKYPSELKAVGFQEPQTPRANASAQVTVTEKKGPRMADITDEQFMRAKSPPANAIIPAGGVDVPLLVDRRGLPQVEVMINGHGPFRFGVETGAAITMMTPETAQAIGIDLKPTGVTLREADSINIGAAQLQKMIVAPVSIGITGVDGLLGLNAYHDLLLTLDYGAKRVHLDRGTLPKPNGRDLLLIRTFRDQLIAFDIQVDGKQEAAILDTQFQGAFMVPPERITDSALVKAPATAGSFQNPIAGNSMYRQGQLKGAIKIGHVTFEHPDVDIKPTGLMAGVDLWFVGNEALREFTMTLDQRQGVVRLARTSGLVSPRVSR